MSATGVVRGVKAGTATIKAIAQDGSNVVAQCKVTVTKPVEEPVNDEPTIVKATPQVVLSGSTFTYNGAVRHPRAVVKVNGAVLPQANYTVAYDGNCVNAGTYRVRVTLKNGYEGAGMARFTIMKAANPLSAKAKTVSVKFSKVKKKAQSIAKTKAFSVLKPQGAVTFKKASGNKKITVSSAGKVTVKKGLKKGNYKITVNVTAAGNGNYAKATAKVTLTVTVK